jgi:hypothetical protein
MGEHVTDAQIAGVSFRTQQTLYFQGPREDSLTELRIKDNKSIDRRGLAAFVLGIHTMDMSMRYSYHSNTILFSREPKTRFIRFMLQCLDEMDE